jgi:hypothetical protein
LHNRQHINRLRLALTLRIRSDVSLGCSNDRSETSEHRNLVTLPLSGRIQAEELPEPKRVMEN